MAYDPNADYRAELAAALAALEPQIRGLEGLILLSGQAALTAALKAKLNAHRARRELILMMVERLDDADAANATLLADGYPDIPKASIGSEGFAEMEGDIADLQTAFALFLLQAENMTVSLGAPADAS